MLFFSFGLRVLLTCSAVSRVLWSDNRSPCLPRFHILQRAEVQLRYPAPRSPTHKAPQFFDLDASADADAQAPRSREHNERSGG